MDITFLGATGTVTGSKYLLSFGKHKVLVDCGLFQGLKEHRILNWRDLPIDPKTIDAVLLTHAHIDHSGYIPILINNGFEGPVYCTQATKDLCSILLPDSGHIHEEDAKFANKHKFGKHRPAKPLYTQAEAEKSIDRFRVIDFGKPYKIIDDFTACWYSVGHILGAAAIRCRHDETDILFSGDLGRSQDPIMKSPKKIQKAEYIVLDSTYGAREHTNVDAESKLENIINKTIKQGGTVLIPAFAVGRSQKILYYLHKLTKEERIPHVPIYLDSPLAINATKIMMQHIKEHKLNQKECAEVCNIARYVNSPEESKMLDRDGIPKIILSASGMATGGRVLHHLKVYLPDRKSTILFVGYQAAGTRGEKILDGTSEIKIHGQMFSVLAKVEYLGNTSAHGDYTEIINWLRNFNAKPKKVFLTHGEPDSTKSLKEVIEKTFGWNCFIPTYNYTENL